MIICSVTNLARQPVLVLKLFRPPSHVLCPPVDGAHLEGLKEGPRVKPALEYVKALVLVWVCDQGLTIN